VTVLEWALKIVILAVLAAVGYVIYLDKANCEEGGGVYVRGAWGYTCLKR
jgi:hypothetical protein